MSDEAASCACLHVEYMTQETAGGVFVVGWWECPQCGAEYVKKLAIEARLAQRDEELGRVREALELPLMFHAGGRWTSVRRKRWEEITGDTEATTHTMCDHIRAALAPVEAGERLLDLRGVAPNATGDLSSEEFVRRLRDEADPTPTEPMEWWRPDDRPSEDLRSYREKAAQCWCTPQTKHIEMDVILADVFARLLRHEALRDAMGEEENK